MSVVLEPITYYYMGAAAAVILVIFFILQGSRPCIVEKDARRDRPYKHRIAVTTDTGDVKMDPNILEIHMKRVRSRIMALIRKFTASGGTSLQLALAKTKKNMEDYLDMNYGGGDRNTEMDTDLMLMRDEISDVSLRDTTTDNQPEDTQADNTRMDIINLIMDIDQIISLIKGSLCNRGRLDLTLIDQLTIELYQSICAARDPFNASDMIDSDTHIDVESIDSPYAPYIIKGGSRLVSASRASTRSGQKPDTNSSEYESGVRYESGPSVLPGAGMLNINGVLSQAESANYDEYYDYPTPSANPGDDYYHEPDRALLMSQESTQHDPSGHKVNRYGQFIDVTTRTSLM